MINKETEQPLWHLTRAAQTMSAWVTIGQSDLFDISTFAIHSWIQWGYCWHGDMGRHVTENSRVQRDLLFLSNVLSVLSHLLAFIFIIEDVNWEFKSDGRWTTWWKYVAENRSDCSLDWKNKNRWDGSKQNAIFIKASAWRQRGGENVTSYF